MMRAQITFDFMLALSALSLLFAFLIAIIHAQNALYTHQISLLMKERLCESLSKTITDAKMSGEGAEYVFYSNEQLNFSNGDAREVHIGDPYNPYICIVPEKYYSTAPASTGEFAVLNSKGNIIIRK